MCSFETVTQDGNSAILSYNLWYKEPQGEWVSLSDAISQQFLVTDLQAGSDYLFKYRAYNLFGFGEFSAESTIKAATRPD